MACRSLFLALLLLMAVSLSVSAAGDGPGNPSTTEHGAIDSGNVYPGAGTAYPYGGYPGGAYPGGGYPGSIFPGYGYGFPPIYPFFPPYYQGPTGGVPGYYPGPVYPAGNSRNARPYHIYPAPEIPTAP